MVLDKGCCNKKKLELSDKNTYGFEVSSYSLEEYEIK